MARRVGLPLVMAGIVQDQRYFDEEVAPHVDGHQVRFLGPVGPGDRPTLLGEAVALLHPICFDEPFGFSVVEAMACGTPVVAFRRGSMPELVDNGRTGYLVDDVDSAIDALRRVEALDRWVIRRTAVDRFGRDRMVDDYLCAYDKLLATC
ncbi:MAG: glycosyltransferase [Acidimicrobiia bacterium]